MLIALLIRNGHINVDKYRLNFFRICLEEIGDYINDTIHQISMANRISKLEQKDYDKLFKKDNDTKNIDHEAQIRQMNKDKS